MNFLFSLQTYIVKMITILFSLFLVTNYKWSSKLLFTAEVYCAARIQLFLIINFNTIFLDFTLFYQQLILSHQHVYHEDYLAPEKLCFKLAKLKESKLGVFNISKLVLQRYVWLDKDQAIDNKQKTKQMSVLLTFHVANNKIRTANLKLLPPMVPLTMILP